MEMNTTRGKSDGSGNTPPPEDTEPDTAPESSVIESITIDSEHNLSTSAPVHADSSSEDRVLEHENATTAHAVHVNNTIPSSGRVHGDQGTVLAPPSQVTVSVNPEERPSSIAALHEELGLLGAPSVEGIRLHVPGFLRTNYMGKTLRLGDLLTFKILQRMPLLFRVCRGPVRRRGRN